MRIPFVLLVLASPVLAQQPQPRPNILFAIADDWSYPHASAYGTTWVKTPAFDRVARQGLLFRNAYTPNAKCAPSRSCILTGRNPWQIEAAANHVPFFPAKFTTYPEALAKHGYAVACTGKGWGPGVAKDADDKPRQLTGRPVNRRQADPPARAISRNDYAANFEDFLGSVPEGQPWCFWYGAQEPHRAYEPGASLKAGKTLADVDRVPPYWPDNETVRTDMLDYALEVEHFDAHLGRMLALLERRGQLDNTLVVVTSDNGMPFPRVKGFAYEASVHLPLAVMWPKGIKAPGRTVDDFVSFVDLAPTFLAVAQLPWERSGMAPSPGRALTDVFADAADRNRDHVVLGQERHDVGRPDDAGYPVRGVVMKDVLYLRNFAPDRWPACDPETGSLNTDGSPTKTWILQNRLTPAGKPFWDLCFAKHPARELYDLRADPHCVSNRADVDAARVKALDDRLTAALRTQDDPRILGNGQVFDAYPYAHPEQRDFYNRFKRGEKLNAGWVNPTDFLPAE